MTDANNVLMEMIRYLMMIFHINPSSAGDFPVLNNPMLKHYATVTHDTRHDQEVGNIDRGYDDDDRGQEQSHGQYYLTFSYGKELSEKDIIYDLAGDYYIGQPDDFDSIASIADYDDSIQIKLCFHTYQQARQSELAMTNADSKMTMKVRSQMASLQRGHPSARDFSILDNAQLSYYSTLNHDVVQDWDEDNGNDDRGVSGDGRGKLQQEEPYPMGIVRRVDNFTKDWQGTWFKLSEKSDGWGRRCQHFSMLRHNSSSDESYTEEQGAAPLGQWNNKGRGISTSSRRW